MQKIILFITTLTLSFFSLAHQHLSPAPEGASVYFISPSDGETLSSPVTVKFGLKGMGVAPAGIDKKHTGHHHILIDTDVLPDLTMPLPATDKIKHFGGGQTQTQLDLAPGTHTLQLVLGNHLHIPHQTPIKSNKITITIK